MCCLVAPVGVFVVPFLSSHVNIPQAIQGVVGSSQPLHPHTTLLQAQATLTCDLVDCLGGGVHCRPSPCSYLAPRYLKLLNSILTHGTPHFSRITMMGHLMRVLCPPPTPPHLMAPSDLFHALRGLMVSLSVKYGIFWAIWWYTSPSHVACYSHLHRVMSLAQRPERSLGYGCKECLVGWVGQGKRGQSDDQLDAEWWSLQRIVACLTDEEPVFDKFGLGAPHATHCYCKEGGFFVGPQLIMPLSFVISSRSFVKTVWYRNLTHVPFWCVTFWLWFGFSVCTQCSDAESSSSYCSTHLPH